MNFIQKIVRAGIKESFPEAKRKTILICNSFSLIFSIAPLVVLFISWVVYDSFNIKGTVLLHPLILIVPLFLNKAGYYTASKVYLSWAVSFLVILNSVVSKLNGVGLETATYIGPRITLIVSTVIPIILFSLRKKLNFIIGLSIPVILIVGFDYIHELFGVGYSQVGLHDISYYPINVRTLTSLLIAVCGATILKYSVLKNEEEKDKLIGELKHKAEENWLIRYTLEGASDGIYWINPDASISDVNRAACDFLGYSKEELIKMKVHDFDPNYHEGMWSEFYKELKKQGTMHFETFQISKNGEIKPVEIISNYVNHENNEFSVAFVRDISARKKAELQLKNAHNEAEQASKAKSEFLANMSHEIRTPLNGVIGFSDLMMRTSLNTTQYQYMSIVSQSARTLLSILNDILDFSKIEAGKLELANERVDLYEMCNQVADLVSFQAAQKQLEMLINIPIDLPRFIWTDEIRLRQILVNLLSNAIKFTDAGEVELKVELLSEDQHSTKLRFSIRDTGIGIDPKNQQRIFEAFAQEDISTTKRFGGTGLGLAISNRLLQMMDSEMKLISALGKGSTFFFDVKYTSHKEKFTINDNTLQIKTALIVDDNATNRLLMKEMLNSQHILVHECESGYKAIEILKEGNKFDIVIIDYHMPALDGIETIRTLRTLMSPEELPVMILYSSSDDAYIAAACEELEVQRRLVKPVKIQQFLDSLSGLNLKAIKPGASVNLHEVTSIHNSKYRVKILIAEDNEVNMLLAKSIMSELAPDALIIEANNGLEALEKYKKHAPDIIFMDVRMPELNGLEACLEIRKLEEGSGARVPIVALTAGTSIKEKEKCNQVGMDDYLSKPVTQIAIAQILNKWLYQYTENKSRVIDHV